MMNRLTLAIVAPPLAVCRYGRAGRCAGPIAVFWLGGIVGLAYGYHGGPLSLPGPDPWTLALGVALWGIATVWSLVTLKGVREESCRRPQDRFCRRVMPSLDERDPLDEIRRSR